MSIAWLNVAALAGLALIALPIAIHLLVRQQTRTLAFPSLRFLHETALTAFRRRRLQDAALLLCRGAIIGSAAAALAGPVLQTPRRTEGYASRVARAIVIVDPAAEQPLERIAAEAFRSASFQRPALADAIADALRWLDEQPPAAREMVFAGVFRRGSIDRADLLAIPETVGLRFLPEEAAAPPAEVSIPMLTRRDGATMLVDRRVQLDADVTSVREAGTTVVSPDHLQIRSPDQDRALAEAALATALEAGVRWPSSDHRAAIVWEGQEPGSGSVRMPVPDPPAVAASAIAEAIESATPRVAVDPILIPRERLTEWSRLPGPPPAGAAPSDEGDRRWLWGSALLLLGLEQWLRRTREHARAAGEEARVA